MGIGGTKLTGYESRPLKIGQPWHLWVCDLPHLLLFLCSFEKKKNLSQFLPNEEIKIKLMIYVCKCNKSLKYII